MSSANKRFVDCFDLVENNRDIVVFERRKDCTDLDLIKIGCFEGNEKMITLTKGKNHTFTNYNIHGESHSFEKGERGCTLISDRLNTEYFKVLECLVIDYAIIMEDDSNCKISSTLGPIDRNKVDRNIDIAGFRANSNDMVLRVNGQFLGRFKLNSLEDTLKDMGYEIDTHDIKWSRSLQTGCDIGNAKITPLQENRSLENLLSSAKATSETKTTEERYKNGLYNVIKVLSEEMMFDTEKEFTKFLNEECGLDNKILKECGFIKSDPGREI